MINSKRKEENNFSLKGYLIEYPLLVNVCVSDFIGDFQDQFVRRNSDGKYVLKKKFSKKALKEIFSDYLLKNIAVLKNKIDGVLIVTDSSKERRESFVMIEDDIDISLDKIEIVLEELFNNFFSSKRQIQNVIWCKHSRLLSNDWGKILEKKVFGKKNFRNLNDELTKKKLCVKEKTKAMSFTSGETKLIVDECVEYVIETLKGV